MARKKKKTTRRKKTAIARRTNTRSVTRSKRRSRSKLSSLASEQKHTLTAIGAAGVAGWLRAKDVTIPHITRLGTPLTYGLGAWLAANYIIKDKNIQNTTAHLATGLLSVGVYEMAQAIADGNNPFSKPAQVEDDVAGFGDWINPNDIIGAIEFDEDGNIVNPNDNYYNEEEGDYYDV